MAKMKLYIDIDNTIYASNEAMCYMYEYITGIKPKAYITKEWNMKDVIPPTKENKEIIHKMFDMEKFFEVGHIYDGCKWLLNDIKDEFDIYFVSVGTIKNLEIKRKWLKEQFPFISENNYILLNQAGKVETINKSCCVDGIIIDDTISGLLSTVNCLKIMYKPQEGLQWQEGYKDLLEQGKIHHVINEWNDELKDILLSYKHSKLK